MRAWPAVFGNVLSYYYILYFYCYYMYSYYALLCTVLNYVLISCSDVCLCVYPVTHARGRTCNPYGCACNGRSYAFGALLCKRVCTTMCARHHASPGRGPEPAVQAVSCCVLGCTCATAPGVELSEPVVHACMHAKRLQVLRARSLSNTLRTLAHCFGCGSVASPHA